MIPRCTNAPMQSEGSDDSLGVLATLFAGLLGEGTVEFAGEGGCCPPAAGTVGLDRASKQANWGGETRERESMLKLKSFSSTANVPVGLATLRSRKVKAKETLLRTAWFVKSLKCFGSSFASLPGNSRSANSSQSWNSSSLSPVTSPFSAEAAGAEGFAALRPFPRLLLRLISSPSDGTVVLTSDASSGSATVNSSDAPPGLMFLVVSVHPTSKCSMSLRVRRSSRNRFCVSANCAEA
mmetsp:Transcript_35933/g.82510  ORF Transcript_35933/g.82510 Transcript_35933/m.82510 type:complete len:238 (+) Transcript_35933:1323-2036(+)